MPFFRSAAFRNLFSAALMAALGQFFISQADHPWTLWIGLAFFIPAIFWFALNSSVDNFLFFPVEKEPSFLTEGILFFLIMALAVFLGFIFFLPYPVIFSSSVLTSVWADSMSYIRDGGPFMRPNSLRFQAWYFTCPPPGSSFSNPLILIWDYFTSPIPSPLFHSFIGPFVNWQGPGQPF